MNANVIIKILSIVSTIILGVGEIIRQVNIYQTHNELEEEKK